MRIGTVVVDLLDVKRVGSERRYGELVRRLEQRGCELHLFARRWDVAAARNLVCHRVPVPGPASLAPLVFAVSAFRVARRWRSHLDLVHSHTQSLGDDIVSPGGGAYRAYLRAMGRGSPWGPRRRTWRPQERVRAFIERWQFRSARRIVTNSLWSGRVLGETYPFATSRTRCVYNGVDATHFSPRVRDEFREATRARLGLGPRELAFLLVGTGLRRKGVLELLEAFSTIGRAAARVIIAGRRSGADDAAITRALDRLRLGGRVVLQDFASDPRPYYAAADAFVLPTKFDPFSNATAEALACGLPVITTTANGVSELLTDGREGFIAPDPHDTAALGRALGRMLDADRPRMAEAARALAETLTWERHVDAMQAMYAEVLRERSARSP
jgi:UDP-glucose:(heptosyl)LPS alpha-1,3-glucosyltransferase